MIFFSYRDSIIKFLLLIIFFLFLAGCGEESKDTRLGALETEVKSLQDENTQLRKKCAKNTITETGFFFTTVVIAGVVFVTNNLIWLILYRRKQ